ncbi:hypothetical protein QOZ83_03950 [Romboutsia sedimentorum]|uniref:hypothetical protein n=1 Tax=Romboutsia sedimentorum TaxID=1368474 RepID=UPI0024DEAC68|nr:hypothetical protein [Romboutsia sedimentorum]MDK2585004.1 hypothetical protein [Romboutsia sedimentorum]
MLKMRLNLYDLEMKFLQGRRKEDGFCIEKSLIKVVEYNCNKDKQDRKIDDKKLNKIFYLDKYKHDNNILKLCFVSAKYNSVKNVIDTETLTSKGKLKSRKDGDEEKTHVFIIFSNESIDCYVEYNYNGISKTKIQEYLNGCIKEYYKENKFYGINLELVPSDEFLAELASAKKLSLVKFIMDKEDLDCSEFRDMSERNDIREDVELIYKPVVRTSIDKKTIRDYLNKKEQSNKIKRIIVEAEGENSTIRLDTEKMKKNYYLEVESEIETNSFDTESAFKEFERNFIGVDTIEVAN